MDCKSFRNEMEELETGEGLSVAAQTHVDSCAACRTFQLERLSLRRLVGSLGAVNAPPDFDFRLRARLAAARSEGDVSFRRARFAPGLRAISIAASFVLLFAAAIVFKQLQPRPINAPAASENQSTAKGNDEQARQPENKAQQLAVATPSGAGLPVESKPPVSTTGGSVQVKDSASKNSLAKAPRNALPAMRNRSPILSNDIAFHGNPPVITPVRTPAANGTDRYAAALLQVSSQPIRVLLHDKAGTMRSVSLKPVIFGSQDFLDQSAEKRNPALDAEGIW